MCSGIVVVVVYDYIVVVLSLYIYYYTAKLYTEQFILHSRGPYVSEGVHIFLKYLDLGVQIFRNIWTGGGTKKGSKFVVTSHVVALLFKEAACQLGYNNPSCTSEPCQWNRTFKTKV